jgi:hypothetical protein
LAFGAGSPYSRKYPNLYALPYRTDATITKDVLDRIIPLAVRESGAKQVRVLYGPGGYRDYPVTPSAQLEILATPDQMHMVADIIGYLAQQTEVMASRPAPEGQTAALDVLETQGKRLAEPITAERFWSRLRVRSPQLQGFLPLANSRGLRVMDADGAWSSRDTLKFGDAVNRAGLESGLDLQAKQLKVRLVRTGNDWKTRPAGQSYLYRLQTGGHADLARRLKGKYQPQVESWIQAAFRKYGARASAYGQRKPGAGRTRNSRNLAASPLVAAIR